MNPINFIKEKQTETKQLLYYYGINGCFIRVQGDVFYICEKGRMVYSYKSSKGKESSI